MIATASMPSISAGPGDNIVRVEAVGVTELDGYGAGKMLESPIFWGSAPNTITLTRYCLRPRSGMRPL